MWLSAALAVGAVWTGLVVSYSIAWIAPSPAILFVAAVLYAIAAGSRRLRRPLSRRLIEQ
jgi:ABC-type Mn2+/Zn2+ transport system permease subunit